MSTPSHLRVAIVGATGETGSSIVNGLLEAGQFSIVALTRPTSLAKPATKALEERGVQIVAADLAGPEDELAAALQRIDVLVSSIGPTEQKAQISLATAAKKAGVKRFVPCAFITVAPPGGIMVLRDYKEEVYNHVKQIYLPYTIIDVGWWYQIAFPRLPSGKIDHIAVDDSMSTLVGDGNTPSALTDLRDIGRYVAKIIADPRTLNRYVLAYNEVWTPNDVYAKLEHLSGEQIPRNYISKEKVNEAVTAYTKAYKANPTDYLTASMVFRAEYQRSWGVRADNTPDNAKYLGYLTSKELYPDLEFHSFHDYLQEVLDGKAKAVYENLKVLRSNA